jgi:TonB family protein
MRDTEFQKSVVYSLIIHIIILLLVFYSFQHIFMTEQPLLMKVSLIEEIPLGNNTGIKSKINPSVNHVKSITNKNISNKLVFKRGIIKTSIEKKVIPSPTINPEYFQNLYKIAPIGVSNHPATQVAIAPMGIGYTGIKGSSKGKADIQGQLASRGIKKAVYPKYPLWAQKNGVEGTIVLKLTVFPNGSVKSIQIIQTSGYTKLDQLAYQALLQWEFDPLPPNVIQINQTGIITFSFNFKNS